MRQIVLVGIVLRGWGMVLGGGERDWGRAASILSNVHLARFETLLIHDVLLCCHDEPDGILVVSRLVSLVVVAIPKQIRLDRGTAALGSCFRDVS